MAREQSTVETDQATALAAAARTEHDYRALFERVPIGLYRTTLNGRFLDANPALATLLGFRTVRELLAAHINELYVDPLQRRAQIAAIGQVRQAQISEICLRRQDGNIIWARDTFGPIYDASGALLYFEGSLEDITEKRRAEMLLQETAERLSLALQAAHAGSWDWDLRTGEVQWSCELGLLLRVAAASYGDLSHARYIQMVHPDDRPAVVAMRDQVALHGRDWDSVHRILHADGSVRWISSRGRIVRDESGQPTWMHGFSMDVTELKRADETLNRLNRALRAVMQCNEAVVRATDETDLLRQICGIMVEVGGYRMAWVGYVEWDARKTVRPVAQAGYEEGYLQSILVTWGEDEWGQGPAGRGIRTGKPQVCHDTQTDPAYGPWRAMALARGYRSSLAMPLVVRGRPVGVLNIYAVEPNVFNAAELLLLESLAQDVSFGIAALRTNAERDQLLEALFESERRLREMLEGAHLVAVTLDFEGQITFCNDFLLELTGRTRAEVMGANWFDLFIPTDQREAELASFAQTGITGIAPAHYQNEILTAQGEDRTIFWNSTLMRDINARVVGLTSLGEDITDQLRAADARDELLTQVVSAHERLQALSRQLVRVQEEERRSLSRELHDEIGQSLTGLKMMLDMSRRMPALAPTNLSQAQELLNELIGKVRDLSLDLRPGILDDLGLLPALYWLFDRYSMQTNVQVSFRHAGVDGTRFATEVETAAYRIVQEALTNVARHASVDEVQVRVAADAGVLRIEIEDSGQGFDPAVALNSGYAAGLSGLRERATLLGGQLSIDAAPGAGAHILVDLPIF